MAWIFRCSEPAAELVRSSRSIELPVDQHQSLVSKGDIVFLWEGGTNGTLTAVGILQSAPYRFDRNSRRQRARVGVSVVLARPLTAEECRQDQILKALAVLERSDQTNFGLNRVTKDRLLSVLAAREPALAESLNLPPDAIRPAHEPSPGPRTRDTGGEHEKDFTLPVREKLDLEAVRHQARGWLSDPLVPVLLRLVRSNRERLRTLLRRELLADIEYDAFIAEFGAPGRIQWAGEDITLVEIAERTGNANAHYLDGLLADGTISTRGNLVWTQHDRDSAEKAEQPDPHTRSLRLRAALAHLLAEGRSLGVRVDRMRRSFDELWPEMATGILSVIEPDEYVPFDLPALVGLQILGVSRRWRNSTDDFVAYCDLVKRVRTAGDLPDLASTHVFLTCLGNRSSGADLAKPADAMRRTHSEDTAGHAGRRSRAPVPVNTPAHLPTEGQAVFSVYQSLRHRGVVTTLAQVISLYLSVKTVPFVCFEGVSGSGKGHLIRSFAREIGGRLYSCPLTNESVGGSSDAPIRFRDLLGIVDIPGRRFYPDVMYRALSHAHECPSDLVFVFVDTPDGWQEDGWLAEYTRLMDLGAERDVEGCTVSVLPSGGLLGDSDYPAEYPFPGNVVLVLSVAGHGACGEIASERANVFTLGMPDLSLEALVAGPAPEGISPTTLAALLAEHHRIRPAVAPDYAALGVWNCEIIHMNSFLEPLGIPVGYRLRNEILRFLAYSAELSAQLPYGVKYPIETAFDHQICQRILPRVLALLEKDEQVGDVVGELLSYAQGSRGPTPRFPHAAARLQAVQRRME
mgnify:FL=1